MNKLRDEIHLNAKKKGFWNKPREFGTLLMLVVSELAEALEADRKKNKLGRAQKIEETKEFINSELDKFIIMFESNIRGSIDEEIADAIIRLLDICGGYDIDIEKIIELKMAYNKTRTNMHGKKY